MVRTPPYDRSAVFFYPFNLSLFACSSDYLSGCDCLACIDWENVVKDPQNSHFDFLFHVQIDHQTLQEINIEDAFHPFTFAANFQSDDFPTLLEVLHMHGKECSNGWKLLTLK